MIDVICLPANMLPRSLNPDAHYFSMYATSPRYPSVGYVASQLRANVASAGLRPGVNTWDFVTFALAVSAADNAVTRSDSANGWTREIRLTLAVHDIRLWNCLKNELAAALRFLTGDYWEFEFLLSEDPIPRASTKRRYSADCVELLSGGVDSLVGAIDLVSAGRQPLFVSHVVRGNQSVQRHFADQIGSRDKPCVWNQAIAIPQSAGEGENSTRARSIVFFAFAALAASGLNPLMGLSREIVVAENGFISLNVSLDPGRVSSFSTKTTHPVYMQALQNIWDRLGLNLKLVMPYRFKTKGEMLLGCQNQTLLKRLINMSTSCGKFAVYNLRHCGRCVPCMVRRASYMKAGIVDRTDYVFENLNGAWRQSAHPNDVGAMALRCAMATRPGFDAKILGDFAFASRSERSDFIGVYKRGIGEVSSLLRTYRII